MSRQAGVNAHREGVLSIGKLTAGQEGYYLAAVAHGAEDYYLGAGEVPGYWIGATAHELGLEGRVSDEAFVALLSGVSPTDGTVLGRGNRRVPALDLTFSATKSVSVAWALAGAETKGEIVAAHREAIAAAVGYLEREAVFVRRGTNGVERLVAGGLVGAAFRHRSSRAGDPQLHTHVVIANAAQGPDGRWSALDARHLYAQARTAGFLYQSELRAGLTARLGVEWGPVVKGNADLLGIPADVCAEFSKRRAQIVAAAGPEATANENRTAALRTREAKHAEPEPGALFAGWATRAAELGFGADEIDAWSRSETRDRDPSRASNRPSVGSIESVRAAAGLDRELTLHQSSFDRRHVLQAIAARAQAGATVGEVETIADRFLASEAVVPLGVGHYGVCYSTPELLEIEDRLLTQADEDRHAEIGIARYATFFTDKYSHTAEQRRMVTAITTDGAGVSVVIGAAGSGKTFALAAARAAWQRDGYTVIGAALAARAAQQLQADAGIPSATLDRLLIDLNRTDLPGLSPSTVVIVDEAAMIGTRKLARLLQHAHYADAKVVLVGDPRQLPEIEAGGAFVALAERLGASHLVENRRQQDPVEARVVAELRAGHVDTAIRRLADHGHVTVAPDRETAYEQMVDAWYQSRLDHRPTIMLAARRADVDALNLMARERMVGSQWFGTEHRTIGGREFISGENILMLRNDRQIGVVNGETGSVFEFHDESMTVLFGQSPHSREIPYTYLEDGNVDYGYATTIHKAQGVTVDRAYILGDGLNAESGYTALTRGRTENHLYLTPGDHDIDHHGAEPEAEPMFAIRDALARSEREPLATTIRRTDIYNPEPSPPRPQRARPEVEADLGMDIGM